MADISSEFDWKAGARRLRLYSGGEKALQRAKAICEFCQADSDETLQRHAGAAVKALVGVLAALTIESK